MFFSRRLVLISTLVFWVSAGLSAEPVLTTRVVGSGFSLPLFCCAPPGDMMRLFVLEQHSGAIKIIHLNDGSITTFLTISASNTGLALTQGGEQGLLGLAFHPNYATNGFFYVNYTTSGGGAAGKTVIERFHATSADAADPASRTSILSYDQPEENHNGGWIGFGNDSYLYIAAGDGGGGNDQHGTIGNGQDRNVLLAKILRIDVDSGSPYSIPSTNPFVGDQSKRGEIWAFGVRNPFRCSFDRMTGDLWVADVGQDAREEVDFIPAGTGGLNFGWRAREGKIATSGHTDETPVTTATDPIYDYPHTNNNECIIGGYVYRGTAIDGLAGTYFFTDFVGVHFWSFRSDGTTVTEFKTRTPELSGLGTIGNVASFGEDAAGELYLCDYGKGRILRIESVAIPELSVKTLTGSVNFKKSNADTLTLNALFAEQPGFDPSGKTLTLSIGGAATVFTLDSKGRGASGKNSVSVQFKSGKPTRLTAMLRKENLSPSWLDEGIDPAQNAKNLDVTFAVMMQIDTLTLQAVTPVNYSGKSGGNGRFRKK